MVLNGTFFSQFLTTFRGHVSGRGRGWGGMGWSTTIKKSIQHVLKMSSGGGGKRSGDMSPINLKSTSFDALPI